MLVRITFAVAAPATALTTGFALAATGAQTAPTCGEERWAVKTLQDPAGRALNLSEEDNDIHLVIKGVNTPGTMIVEFPRAPSCAANATIGAKTRMKNARNAFIAACGTPSSSSFTPLTGTATIRGIGFFDFLHGQTGVAPNGIELHPVLRFMNATC